MLALKGCTGRMHRNCEDYSRYKEMQVLLVGYAILACRKITKSNEKCSNRQYLAKVEYHHHVNVLLALKGWMG